MADVNVYVFSGDNCKYESMTKEQILAAIQQAVSTHEITDVDTGFVTKIKERNQNKQLQFWVGKQSEYEAIPTKDENTFYIVTDDSSFDDIADAVNQMQADVGSMQTAFGELRNDVESDIDRLEADIAGVAQNIPFTENKTLDFFITN